MDFRTRLSIIKVKSTILKNIGDKFNFVINYILRVPRQIKKNKKDKLVTYIRENLYSLIINESDKYILYRLKKSKSVTIFKYPSEMEIYRDRCSPKFYIASTLEEIFRKYKMINYFYKWQHNDDELLDINKIYNYLFEHYKKENQLLVKNEYEFYHVNETSTTISLPIGINITLK